MPLNDLQKANFRNHSHYQEQIIDPDTGEPIGDGGDSGPVAIEDVVGLEDALAELMADPTTSSGDVIMRLNTTNFALSATDHGFDAVNGAAHVIHSGAIENIHDGNDGTSCGTNNWIRSDLYWWIDLGETKTITAFRVKNTDIDAYRIESCPSGFTGGATGTWTARTSTLTAADTGVVNLVAPASVDARFWRVIGVNAGDSGGSLAEFAVYGSAVSRFNTTTTGRSVMAASQGAAIANATDATSTMNRLNDVLAFLRARGDIAT